MSGTPDARTANALLFADYARRWRAWRGIVAEEQAALQQRQATVSLGDLLDAPRDGAPPVPQAAVAPALRKEIMAALEQRRSAAMQAASDQARAAGAPHPDADTVYAQLLTHLQEELTGQHHPEGWALFLHEGHLLAFDQQALGTTSEADFLVAKAPVRVSPRQRWVLGGVLAVLLVVGATVLWPRAGGSAAAPAPVAVLANGQAVALWDALMVSAGDQTWPVAYAQPGWPLKLCLPAEAAPHLTLTTTVTVTGTQSLRTYRLQASADTPTPDLLLAACTTTPPTPLAVGVLVTTARRVPLAVTPVAITAVRPERDPATIPPTQMRVTLVWERTTVTAALRAARLVVADGQTIAPSGEIETADGVAVAYLVPLLDHAQPAGVLVTTPGALPAHAAVTIPAPETRAAWLATVVTLDATPPQWTADGTALTTTLTLTATTDVVLTPSDLLLDAATRGSPPLWTPPTLAAATPQTVTVRVPVDPRAGRVTLTGFGQVVTWDWHGGAEN